MARAPQLALGLLPRFGWGGARAGAGRKPAGAKACLPHRSRAPHAARAPVHVTLRAREHVWNLRSVRCYRILAAALRGVGSRADFRVVHFSVQGNHLHLIVEATSAAALSSGVRALSIRLAKGLNALMGRRGALFADRYHARSLRTPAEVRNAVDYVLGNFASHAQRRAEPVARTFVDRFSSGARVAPDGDAPPVRAPETWLLARFR
jgi:REP element-mobilizing transposase RayT